MSLQAAVQPYILKFKKPATTSRGAYHDRTIWILKIWNSKAPHIVGLGECAPLKGLSIDDVENYENILNNLVKNINLGKNIEKFDFIKFPSIKFGLETALLDLKNGGKQIIFKSFYSIGKQGIPINGLVWMNDFDSMKQEVLEKLESGFECIKLKIGAIDFEKEIELLKIIRKHPKGQQIILRLDANGAFKKENVLEKLNQLKPFNIHSIEQPIAVNQIEEMSKLCSNSPIPIALDEELIGKHTITEIEDLLNTIKPQFIVLKPNLIGGFIQTGLWIKAAEKFNIEWWITSALESNIGLNAIAQFASTLMPKLHSGLGTGKLYLNNLQPNTKINEGFLWRDMGHEISDNLRIEE